jgi:hypothetical protein
VDRKIEICPLEAVSTKTGERRRLFEVRDHPLSCWFQPLGKEEGFLIGSDGGTQLWREGESARTVLAATEAICVSVDHQKNETYWCYPQKEGKLEVCSLNLETRKTTGTTLDLEKVGIRARSVESVHAGKDINLMLELSGPLSFWRKLPLFFVGHGPSGEKWYGATVSFDPKTGRPIETQDMVSRSERFLSEDLTLVSNVSRFGPYSWQSPVALRNRKDSAEWPFPTEEFCGVEITPEGNAVLLTDKHVYVFDTEKWKVVAGYDTPPNNEIVDGREYFGRYLGVSRRAYGETWVLEHLVKWIGIVMKAEQGGQ